MALKTEIDERHLARAIELAEQGRGQVSPNPLVGAVIATDQETIAEGYHAGFGAPHAEVEAIRSAAARGLDDATLYVSLEPCCHRGKTPPGPPLASRMRRCGGGDRDSACRRSPADCAVTRAGWAGGAGHPPAPQGGIRFPGPAWNRLQAGPRRGAGAAHRGRLPGGSQG